MSKDEAAAFTQIDQYAGVIRNYENWLDAHEPEDSFELGNGESMSYAKVERRVRTLQRELNELKDEYGPRRKELAKKVRQIYEAGVEALRSGKKPGKKAKKDDDRDEKTKRKSKRIQDRPRSRGLLRHHGGGDIEDMDVDSEDGLLSYVEASIRKKRKH